MRARVVLALVRVPFPRGDVVRALDLGSARGRGHLEHVVEFSLRDAAARRAAAAAAAARVVLNARPQNRVASPPVRRPHVHAGQRREPRRDVHVPAPHREVERAVAVVGFRGRVGAALEKPSTRLQPAVSRGPVQRRAAVLPERSRHGDAARVHEPLARAEVAAARGPVQRAAAVRVHGLARVEAGARIFFGGDKAVDVAGGCGGEPRAQRLIVVLLLPPRRRASGAAAPPGRALRVRGAARKRSVTGRFFSATVPNAAAENAASPDFRRRLFVRQRRAPRRFRGRRARLRRAPSRPVLPQPAAVHGVVLPAPGAHREAFPSHVVVSSAGGDEEHAVRARRRPRRGDGAARRIVVHVESARVERVRDRAREDAGVRGRGPVRGIVLVVSVDGSSSVRELQRRARDEVVRGAFRPFAIL
mmetsp:Transcript_3530/g.12015  ORF Transcript_3530/g.12015 Transcript_3530/m.12015 type:complete len:418 (-) Transcript_3530:162-1415(-)